MRLVVGHAGDAHRIIPSFPRLLLGQTCATRIQISGELYNARSQAAAIRGVHAREILGKATPGDIRGRSHCGPLRLARQVIVHLRAISHRVDILQIRLLIFIYDDRAPVHLNA